jgi:acetylornithine/succinyldiaminopimelate/putrescine aminotransferase
MSSAGDSFSHTSLHVGSNWMVRCSAYTDQTPILTVNAGDTAVSITPTGREATEAAVKFARALARDSQAFAAEVERLYAGQTAADAAGQPGRAA